MGRNTGLSLLYSSSSSANSSSRLTRCSTMRYLQYHHSQVAAHMSANVWQRQCAGRGTAGPGELHHTHQRKTQSHRRTSLQAFLVFAPLYRPAHLWLARTSKVNPSCAPRTKGESPPNTSSSPSTHLALVKPCSSGGGSGGGGGRGQECVWFQESKGRRGPGGWAGMALRGWVGTSGNRGAAMAQAPAACSSRNN